MHAKGKPMASEVDLKVVAQTTAGFTGADLENLLNEAALLSAREDRRFITRQDLHEAMMKVIAGPEKRSRVVTPHARRLTAYHEAGHAVAAYFLPTQEPVPPVTIVPRGNALGLTDQPAGSGHAPYHAKRDARPHRRAARRPRGGAAGV